VVLDGFTVIGMKGRSDQDYGAPANTHYQPASGEVQFESTNTCGHDPSWVGSGSIVRNMTIQHSMGDCVKAYNHESGVSYLHNTINDCGISGDVFDHGMYIGGINVTASGNTVSNVSGYCIQDYGAGSGNIVANNTVSNCLWGGITSWLPNSIIKNNVVKNSGQGITSSSRVDLFNNLIASNNVAPVVTLIGSGAVGLNSGLPYTSSGTYGITGAAYVKNGSTNELWLASGQLKNVTVLNADTGQFVATLSNACLSGNTPQHIGVFGSYVYIQDAQGWCRFRTDHTAVDTSTNYGDSHLSNPLGFTMSGSRVYVANFSTNSVLVYSQTATGALTYVTSYATGLSLSGPRDITTVGHEFWIANGTSNTITRMSATGGLIATISPNSLKPQTCVSSISTPQNIWYALGKVWLANNGQVWVFNPDGTVSTVLMGSTVGCAAQTGITSAGQDQASPKPTTIFLSSTVGTTQIASSGSTLYVGLKWLPQGIAPASPGANLIENNTLYNNGSVELNFGLSATSITAKNNIIYGSNSKDFTYTNGTGAPNSTNDYNIYFNGTAVTTGSGSHSKSVDPKFVSAATGDFRLLPTSPAIGAGATLSSITSDIVGTAVPQGSGPDIGAYEYAAPSTPTSLAQYLSNGTTPLATGGTSTGTTVVLSFSMPTVNGSGSLTPQVEVQPVGTAFTNTPNYTGSAVASSGTPVTGTVSVTSLANASYHWQARASNTQGQSSWVSYGGNAESAADFVINTIVATSLTLTSSLNPSTFGSGVTLTAAVSPSTATGTVTFKDGGTTLGTATLGHGSGSYTTSTLSGGSHTLTAVYAGNSTYATSTSDPLTQTVNKANTATPLTSSLNPSTFGSGVILTATVSPSTATGTVTFKDGSTTLGAATLGHGSGTYTTSSLGAGSHSLTAVYAGNVDYNGSTSSVVTQTVNKADSTTVLTSSLNPSTFGSGVTLTATVSPSSATGTVTFKDGVTTLGTATLGHGSGSLTTSSLSPGSHSLTAVYGANSQYGSSTSSALTQTVNKANSATALSSSLNPATFGSGVTLTASVSPSTATGTVTFKDGSTTLGTATLGHGSGTYTTSVLGVGSHSLTAVYAGNGLYLTSTSSTVTQTITKANTATALVSSLNPSTFGSGVTLTATVTPSSATGTVTFKDGSTTLGTATLGHGSGTYTTSALGVGSHSLTAVYAGNGDYNGGTSSAVTQTVTKAATATVLLSDSNPSAFGQTVTFTASVLPSSATGTITFKDGGSTLGTATLGHGSGTYSTAALSAGSHSMTAVYAGNGDYLTSTSFALAQTVSSSITPTSTALSSSLNPSTFGLGITLTATVTPSAATGTITFKDGLSTLGTATLGHGSGSLTTSALSAGSHGLTAVYGGNSLYAGSTSPVLTQTVNKANTATSITSSLNPSTFGSGVTLKATVTPGSATGTVTFNDGATALGTATLGHGSGSLTTSVLSAGSRSLTAVYSGNSNYLTSTSATLTQTVQKANTATSITSSLNPSTYGSGLTLTATVSPSTATGAVTFKDGGRTLGSATLAQGSGVLTLSTLGGGVHALTAVYDGDANYNGSTSATLTQTVSRAMSSIVVTTSQNPATQGATVTFTATVTPSDAPGSVLFSEGGNTIGTASLFAGTAVYSTSSLAVGSHDVVATYTGNTDYLSGTSATLTQVISAAPSSGGGSSGGGGGGSGGGSGGERGHGSPSNPATSPGSTIPVTQPPVSPGDDQHLAVTVGGQSLVFRDVAVSAWFAPYVQSVAQAGIVSGYADATGKPLGLYGPANPVTYAEIAKMAIEASGTTEQPLGPPRNRFAHGHWAERYIALAEQLHLSVYGPTRRIDTPATRGAVVQTLLEALGIPLRANAHVSYHDLPGTNPYAKAIATATALGILSGDTNPDGTPKGTVRPDEAINRAEAAKMVVLALKAATSVPAK
jgi:hypothetical protein